MRERIFWDHALDRLALNFNLEHYFAASVYMYQPVELFTRAAADCAGALKWHRLQLW